ncbi:MAG: nucleotide exchange factor GrpE [Micrococcales bacterium 73-13]|nr:MAG: nucleotide exchange factor GrpE [Micrococcales bacterium 73-13]
MSERDDEDDLLGRPPSDRPSAQEGASGEQDEELIAVDAAHDAEAEALSESDQAILDGAQQDLVAEMRDRAARAEAELVNFRNRVERDRQANREAAIAEVLRALLPALDDLDRAEAHGDLPEGSPMGMIAAKLRTGLERFGLTSFGAAGDPFDPALHEALFQQPTPGAQSQTVLEVVEAGYRFGDRVVRPAKVAVAVPAE